MLTPFDQKRILEGMYVYEHEWRYLSGYLGEPFLLDDILAFFDGRVLNVAAFVIGENVKSGQGSLACRLGLIDPEIKPCLVHVWGELEIPESLKIGDQILPCVYREEARQAGEYSIDMAGLVNGYSPEAKKAIRAIKRDSILTSVEPGSRLSWKELSLIEAWKKRISPGVAGAIAGASIPSYILSTSAHIARAFIDGRLVGFSVFVRPRPDKAVNLMSFSERLPGIKIEDSLLHATIEHCMYTNVKNLHLGYAGSEALARFKKKWGAAKSGPDYEQAIFCSDPAWKEQISNFSFFWWARLLSMISIC
jgi:hypothetical protein